MQVSQGYAWSMRQITSLICTHMLRTHLPKKLFFSLLIVLMWLGFLTEGSRALFSDSAVLAGNGLTTGTADLLISNSQNGSSTTFAESRPGFPLVLSPGHAEEKYFILKNTSSSTVPLSIAAMVVYSDGPGDLRSLLTFEFTPVDSEGTSVGASVTGTLDELIGHPITLGSTINEGSTQRFRLRTLLHQTYNKQNTPATYDLVFIGTQHVSS